MKSACRETGALKQLRDEALEQRGARGAVRERHGEQGTLHFGRHGVASSIGHGEGAIDCAGERVGFARCVALHERGGSVDAGDGCICGRNLKRIVAHPEFHRVEEDGIHYVGSGVNLEDASEEVATFVSPAIFKVAVPTMDSLHQLERTGATSGSQHERSNGAIDHFLHVYFLSIQDESAQLNT